MEIDKKILKATNILSAEQKKRFKKYLPEKVYKTERNISILVALSQLCMIILFLSNGTDAFHNVRARGYFALYIFLLASTCAALVLYRYTNRRKNYTAFTWLRRIYALMLCFWVLGITYMELIGGKGLSVYCYLLPTTAALLLLTPAESLGIFGGTWVLLLGLILNVGNTQKSIFGNLTNSIFVTVLTLFISYRYYRSMAVEFCDREIIDQQYIEISNSNNLLQQMVHIDQLTGLYNRRYLLERLYPLFGSHRQTGGTGMFLMMDIDFFKQYNDNYGHIQGDECLKTIACILKEFCMEQGASAVRYGGEEFLIVKTSDCQVDGIRQAENLLARIREANIERDDIELGKVTVSAGLWTGELNRITNIEEALKYADNALYEAKSTGRNKMVEYTY